MGQNFMKFPIWNIFGPVENSVFKFLKCHAWSYQQQNHIKMQIFPNILFFSSFFPKGSLHTIFFSESSYFLNHC